MEPIQNSEKGFRPYEFKKLLLKICQEHSSTGKALAFAFIVYRFQDPHIIKILNDLDYYNALNKISGKKLTVFYIDSNSYVLPKSKQKVRRHEAIKSRLTHIGTGDLDLGNSSIMNIFNIESEVDSPFVIFFQASANKITDSCIVKLDKERMEDSFLELKSLVKNAVSAISQVSPENQKNKQEIYNLIEAEITSHNKYSILRMIGNGVNIILKIKELIGLAY